MTTLVFGHKSPDTDSTGSPIVWAWYLNEIKGIPAKPVLLGEPNTEALFMLDKWDLEKPEILTELEADTKVVIVDTNNPAELPDNINDADITGIIDHHRLVAGLETRGPIEINIQPLACTATIMYKMIGKDWAQAPRGVKAAALSCILSDTLEFRSPTTTQEDRAIAHDIAQDLGVDITDYATEMFAAKSDVSSFSEAELLRMDSKGFDLDGTNLRVSVLETTSPAPLLERKDALMAEMPKVAEADGAAQVLLFIVDILKEEATLLVPNDMVKHIAEQSFGAEVSGDTVVLPGVMSRKKQIIPNLKM
ncbi:MULTISPECIES: manganese-dependent inorganic pyrophosphatase [Sulfitobacter]|uniref:manganese-dependent inorganic pyrophosphatase n=1 Tax=Sulfitobacter TaxID=60136 RepID=UPI0023074378|nr:MULTISPECIES: manganese-dependent inorganic pyrophosphatase [Sulfitobacter]MDF3382299.1 manganese-dependent inorganic pyrophosphatase [Sulfitobacter sp. Ks11]MDF3385718.1 manganese-dependent inorganic pyrophosphatase [Sulfitobacter sp. M85]MDF3389137.1 manganese-dependent inorganic pyrophosphatase [Sulfitobacter sp. Ks16]MDF3399774.1 manganese-dependent inorganic pyrophosphatase [Sulfitobacter sp. KE39]MDF3403195.1 manganese-dependent inorganic pyrophosphatase [Sulfitobacter sp. Ks35]